MDKKNLIALGLISAFSIDNATGMNGIIENPSFNESQSMKTTFSDDQKSFGSLRMLFEACDYWDYSKFGSALNDVSGVVCSHDDINVNECMNVIYSMFVYFRRCINFMKSPECKDSHLTTLKNIFILAPTLICDCYTYEMSVEYNRFLQNIEERGLQKAMMDNDFCDQVRPFVNKLSQLIH